MSRHKQHPKQTYSKRTTETPLQDQTNPLPSETKKIKLTGELRVYTDDENYALYKEPTGLHANFINPAKTRPHLSEDVDCRLSIKETDDDHYKELLKKHARITRHKLPKIANKDVRECFQPLLPKIIEDGAVRALQFMIQCGVDVSGVELPEKSPEGYVARLLYRIIHDAQTPAPLTPDITRQ